MRPRALYLLLLGLLPACGQSAEPRADIFSFHGAAAGASVGGSPSVGAAGGSAGQGGEPPLIFDCDHRPDEPSLAGPRADGLAPTTGSCASLTDATLIERASAALATTPTGFFYEPRRPDESPPAWRRQCSPTLSNLVEWATIYDEKLAGTLTTEWFYEATYCDDPRRRFRAPRCDYFDGRKFPNRASTAQDLAFLGSFLWWHHSAANAGARLLGYDVQVDGSQQIVELCSLQISYGGTLIDADGVPRRLCDTLDLYSTKHVLQPLTQTGEVRLGQAELVRQLRTNCPAP